jgi:hypothetical protein
VKSGLGTAAAIAGNFYVFARTFAKNSALKIIQLSDLLRISSLSNSTEYRTKNG